MAVASRRGRVLGRPPSLLGRSCQGGARLTCPEYPPRAGGGGGGGWGRGGGVVLPGAGDHWGPKRPKEVLPLMRPRGRCFQWGPGEIPPPQRPHLSRDGPATARVIFAFGNAAACSHLSG